MILTLLYYNLNCDSESEEDDSMSTSKQTCSSAIHKLLSGFFKNDPIDDGYFADNMKCFIAMFNTDPALWNKYNDAKTAFNTQDTTENQIKQASEIADCAIALRASSVDSAASVITTNMPQITLNGLNAIESVNMKKLHDLLIRKMSQGKQTATDPDSARKMLSDFKNDIEVSKVTLVLPHKWAVGNRIWKINEISKQFEGHEFDFSKYDVGAGWKDVKALIESLKDDKPTDANHQMQQMSNKFAVDAFAVVINHYKKTLPEANQSLQNLLDLLKIVAAFTTTSSISKIAWSGLTQKHKASYPGFFDALTTANLLYDNPAKLTKSRLFSCAATLFLSYDPTAVFAKRNLNTVPRMIVAIFALEEKYNEISNEQNTTSTSEHMMHLLLSVGEQFSYAYNRNAIPNSVRTVRFVIGSENI